MFLIIAIITIIIRIVLLIILIVTILCMIIIIIIFHCMFCRRIYSLADLAQSLRLCILESSEIYSFILRAEQTTACLFSHPNIVISLIQLQIIIYISVIFFPYFYISLTTSNAVSLYTVQIDK